ncbi:hypothetical protein, conserved [Plasmodium gonderi]|uniref:Uncharacterized protein n=1 Tax=Plasmodium gonderi TaxID=77519 RepID=A0A1Y1JQ63_PLAGO|nr:hypothetical protein, conserved [Plasmodium gonderi]GAW82204.1 hypothetical protein, conserved [Plasmodium gonderi]
MDKLYGDYDKVFEKYKNSNLHKRKNEKEIAQDSKVETKEKNALKREKKVYEKKPKKGNNLPSSEGRKDTFTHPHNNLPTGIPEYTIKGKKKDDKGGTKKANNDSTHATNHENGYSSDHASNHLGNHTANNVSNNLNPNSYPNPVSSKQNGSNYNRSCNNSNNNQVRERSVNEYKIRKKVSIEINQKIYSDSENTHFDDKSFLENKFGMNENNYNSRKKKIKNDDQKVNKKMLNKKDKIKFFVNFLFVLYYIFFLFHYIIEIQLNQIYNVVINTFTIIITTVLLCYIYFLKARNKKLKKIIFYITTYINLLYCLHIFNTFTFWLNIYLNFTLSKRIYLKYKTLYKNISFVFSYFSFDEIFFFLLIFYALFFLTTSMLTFTLFYYIYNFINYSF